MSTPRTWSYATYERRIAISLFEVGGVAGRLPLVEQRRQRLHAVEVEAPERVVVRILGPGERPAERRQGVAARGPDVVEQVVRGRRVALVEQRVHALLAERDWRCVDGLVRDAHRGRRGHRGRRAGAPELHRGRVRAVRLGVRVPGVLVRRLGDLRVAEDAVDVELDPVAEGAASAAPRAGRVPPTVAPGVTPPRPTATICPWPSSTGAPWFAVTEAVPCELVEVTVAEISRPRSAATGVYVDEVAPAIVAHGVVEPAV